MPIIITSNFEVALAVSSGKYAGRDSESCVRDDYFLTYVFNASRIIQLSHGALTVIAIVFRRNTRLHRSHGNADGNFHMA